MFEDLVGRLIYCLIWFVASRNIKCFMNSQWYYPAKCLKSILKYCAKLFFRRVAATCPNSQLTGGPFSPHSWTAALQWVFFIVALTLCVCGLRHEIGVWSYRPSLVPTFWFNATLWPFVFLIHFCHLADLFWPVPVGWEKMLTNTDHIVKNK